MAIKRSPGCNCCECSEGGSLCVTATTGCSAPNDKVNASVILQTKDATPVTVANCTTTGQLISVTRTATGSGYTDGTGYALGISGGGGSGATGTFDVVAGRVTNIQVTNGGSGYTSNPTISFPGAGGSNAAATASTVSKCCVGGIPVGTYTLSVGIPGSTKTQDVTIKCKQTTNANTTFASPAPGVGTLCVEYYKCSVLTDIGDGFLANIIPGEGSVTISGTGGVVASGSVDGTGKFCATLAAGSYTMTLSTSGGGTFTKTRNVTACSSGIWQIITTDMICGGFTAPVTPRTINCTGTMIFYDEDGNTLGSCSVTTDDSAGAVGCISIPETDITFTDFSKWFSFDLIFPLYTMSAETTLPEFYVECYPSDSPATVNLGPVELCPS